MMMMKVEALAISWALFILCGYSGAGYGGCGNVRVAIPLLTVEKTIDEMHHYEQGEFHLGMFQVFPILAQALHHFSVRPGDCPVC
jgi:hypothetical protein